MSVARTCIQSKKQALKTSDKWSATSICICCLHSGDLCCFKYPFQFISLLSCVSFLSSLKNWMLGSSSPIKGWILLCINKKQLCQTRASQLTLPAFSEASSLSYLTCLLLGSWFFKYSEMGGGTVADWWPTGGKLSPPAAEPYSFTWLKWQFDLKN